MYTAFPTGLSRELLDVNALLADSLKLENPGIDSEIPALVTKLLSRTEMLASPEALTAVRKEAEGLVNAGTWDLNSVRGQADVRSEAKKSGISVHFGQLMTIASIKFYELASHLQKMKGRIVYRGDYAKDEHGSAAVYQELGANPTSVQGLNACIATDPCLEIPPLQQTQSKRTCRLISKESIRHG